MTKDVLELTNDQVIAAAEGIMVLQRLYMSRAHEHKIHAQKAMDIAAAASALAAQAGVVRRAREILLVQYGKPQVQQGQQGHVLDPDKAEQYNGALNAIMTSTVKMTFAPITITADDISAMANQPGALGAIWPIVTLAE